MSTPRRRLPGWGWALIGVLLVSGLIGWAQWSKAHAPRQVRTVLVRRGAFVRTVSGTGHVDARVYSLTFPRPGQVAVVAVREGDTVAAGQVLAELVSTKEREELRALQARLRALPDAERALEEEARASRMKVRHAITTTTTQLVLSRRLLAVGAAAPEEVRVLERQLAEVQAQLAAQDATTANRRRELAVQRATLLADTQGLNRLLREAKLVAPVQGVVSAIAVKAGETASGAITLVASGSLRVKAKFAEVEAGEIHPGQQARIEVDALPDTPLAATVADLGVQAEIQGQGGNALLPVTLRFVHAAAAAYARSGYTVTARITTQRLPDALHLPLEALMEEERKGRMTTSVWRVDPAQRTVAKVPVRVLVRSLTRAAIAGLPAGTRVVTLPPDDLKAGARVRWETRRRRR